MLRYTLLKTSAGWPMARQNNLRLENHLESNCLYFILPLRLLSAFDA